MLFSSSSLFSFFSYFCERILSSKSRRALSCCDSSYLLSNLFLKYFTLSISLFQNSSIALSSSPTFLTKVKGSSKICNDPYWLPTDKMWGLWSWNFIDERPTDPTEYCIVHLWDWSIKSQISMVPLDLPINKIPDLVGLQHPHVW